ncbi:hypothetical protein [Geothrix sp.]|uniref:hypothetical protein n=1 Tax=Geothrix sp. TaxID=1962974 RepID=UPI00262A52E7|nr:hypothetical protein [Geothrix sp.]WIL21928.1 MAG: hypothetical protein QOZ81_001208 [Geothrix sp.]
MRRWLLVLGCVWMSVLPCPAQVFSPATQPGPGTGDRLDHGLLDPAWFGQGPPWTHDWRADFLWARTGVRWEAPMLYLVPWEEPRFLSTGDVLDYARGGEVAEAIQGLIRTRLKAMGDLRLAATPQETPYHAVGRLVEARHIRQGSSATLGPMAGLPTQTWDFKVVDVRTGQTLLASHHRSVGGSAATWFTALERPLREMAGLPPPQAWDMPPDSQVLEDRSRIWTTPGLQLPPGGLVVRGWTADTDTGGLWKVWTGGLGASLATQTGQAILDRLTRGGLARLDGGDPTHLLDGQVFTAPRFLKPRYRAWVTEAATGRVVARYEFLPPLSTNPAGAVAERLGNHLQALMAAPPTAPVPVPPVQPGVAWEGLDRLQSVAGAVDKAWVSPRLSLAGRTLHVADWDAADLGAGADGHDRMLASFIGLRAPAWLFGALAWHGDRGFGISRQVGGLRLEGRVVRLYQTDPRKFGTAMAGAMTLGLATRSEGVLQLRVLDAATGETLALVEQTLVSFQAASDGIPYKSLKWLAQDLVPWLLEKGGRPAAQGPQIVNNID